MAPSSLAIRSRTFAISCSSPVIRRSSPVMRWSSRASTPSTRWRTCPKRMLCRRNRLTCRAASETPASMIVRIVAMHMKRDAPCTASKPTPPDPATG
ncbi:MAG: hypothetical protein OXG72_12835, partial [Acidobacteria bacterium]|nr:hypothetical protein [Acidobacteriota bacterium]